MIHIGDEVVSFFKSAATKLEELQVQAALGKAELSDKLEEIKKDVKSKIEQVKSEANALIDKDKGKYGHLKNKVEHLEVQLALAKAEGKEELAKQKKNLQAAIEDVKAVLTRD